MSSWAPAGNTSSRRLYILIRCGVHCRWCGWYRPQCGRSCSNRSCRRAYAVGRGAPPAADPSVTISRGSHRSVLARPLPRTRRERALFSARSLFGVPIREESASSNIALQKIGKRQLPGIHPAYHIPGGRRDGRRVLMESKRGAEVCDVPVLYPRQIARDQLDAARAGPPGESEGT